MRKADIGRRISQAAEVDEQSAYLVMESILQILKAALKAGESITVQGFGTFKIRDKSARHGRNPRTGETTTISARKVVTFHASPLFKQYVNGSASANIESIAQNETVSRQ